MAVRAPLHPQRPHPGGGGLPPVAGPHDGGGSGWVRLTSAADDIEAHLILGRLLEAGIEVTTLKDRSSPGAWLQGGADPWAPVTLLVRALQLEDARLVLIELAYQGPAAESPRSSSPASRWRAPLLWWVAAICMGVMFTGLGLVQAADDLEECRRSGTCSAPAP